MEKLIVQRTISRLTLFTINVVGVRKPIYWSFFRSKINKYLKEYLKTNQAIVEFGEATPGASLDYDFNYSPSEYLTGSVAYVLITVFFWAMGTEYITLKVLPPIFCIWCSYSYFLAKDSIGLSKKANKVL